MPSITLNLNVENAPNPARKHFEKTNTFRLQYYDGSTSWRIYLGQFERIARINVWETNKVDYFWIHLAGEALSYVQGLPSAQTRNFEIVSKALDQRFGAERLASVHKAELLLVFSKCFRAAFGAFSTFKFKVIEGTN